MWAKLNLVLLAHSGLRIDREFHTSVSNEDYSYFSGLSDDIYQRNFFGPAYHVCQASGVLALGDACRKEAFLSDHLLQESERFEKQVDDLTIEKNRYLEEIQGASNYFLAIEEALEPFRDHDPLIE